MIARINYVFFLLVFLIFTGYWMFIHFNVRNSKGENKTLKESFQLTMFLFRYMFLVLWDGLKSIFTGKSPDNNYGVIFR